jgi:hypothetical protein
VLHPDGGHDRLPLFEHRAKVTLHRCGQARELSFMKDLGLDRDSGGFEPSSQVSGTGLPMDFPVEEDSRHEDP